MPKLDVRKDDLEKLVGKKLVNLDELLLATKVELDGEEGKYLKLDCKDTNRPDLWSTEGIARIIRGQLGIETGIPKYKYAKTSNIIKIDENVSSIRPYMIACVVRNVKFDEASLEQMIQLQEKIAISYGRKRKMAAVGVFDYSKMKMPLTYRAIGGSDIKFAPLGFKKEMTPEEILAEHPKGKEHGHLLPEGKCLILTDADGNVCSMPPIINSEFAGKVTENTRDVFAEVSGHNLNIMSTALNVIVTALADRGGKIESVTSVLPDRKKIVSPNFEERAFSLNINDVHKFLGLKISGNDIVKLLEKQRYSAKITGKNLNVRYLNLRNDIMHERDIIEDIAIAYGYNDMKPEIPRLFTIGGMDKLEDALNSLKDIMVGLGFQEIMTFILNNKDNQSKNMDLDIGCCEISNPVSENWNCLRPWMLPSSLGFLSKNMHEEYPQKIFEIGDSVRIDMSRETKTRDIKKIICAISDVRVGYGDISSVLDAFMKHAGCKYALKEKEYPFLINGRSAEVLVNGNHAGFIGEVHPKVLRKWGLQKAVVTFEMNAEGLLDLS